MRWPIRMKLQPTTIPHLCRNSGHGFRHVAACATFRPTSIELELKLRRMESHVTSGQFELQRELKRIDV